MCWVSVTAWARRVRIKGFSPKRHAFIRSRDDKTKGRGMATDLDRRMDAGIAQLTSAEGTLPLTDIALDGRRLPMIASAPPALPHYFAHYCREHADATFLVAGADRIAFAEIHAEAERVATARSDAHTSELPSLMR